MPLLAGGAKREQWVIAALDRRDQPNGRLWSGASGRSAGRGLGGALTVYLVRTWRVRENAPVGGAHREDGDEQSDRGGGHDGGDRARGVGGVAAEHEYAESRRRDGHGAGRSPVVGAKS